MIAQYQYIEDELLQLVDACGVAMLLAREYLPEHENAVIAKLRHIKEFIPEASDHIWGKFRQLPRRPVAGIALRFNGRPPVSSYCELALQVAAAIELTFEMVPDDTSSPHWRSWSSSFVPKMITDHIPDDLGFNIQRELRTVANIARETEHDDDTVVENREEDSNSGANAKHDREAVAARVLAGDDSAAVAEIAATKELTLDQKMTRIALVNSIAVTWPSATWAELLGKQDSRIRQLDTWKKWREAEKAED